MIDYVCEQDVEKRGDDAYSDAAGAAEKLERKVAHAYKNLQNGFDIVTDDLEDLLSVDDEKLVGKVKTLLDKLDKERGLLSGMEGTVNEGEDNPQVKDALAYNMKMHEHMQRAGKYECDVTSPAVSLEADCVSFAQCVIWEFSPATEPRGDILKRARGRIAKIEAAYEDDERAADCYPGGFEAKIATYKACTPRSRAWDLRWLCIENDACTRRTNRSFPIKHYASGHSRFVQINKSPSGGSKMATSSQAVAPSFDHFEARVTTRHNNRPRLPLSAARKRSGSQGNRSRVRSF